MPAGGVGGGYNGRGYHPVDAVLGGASMPMAAFASGFYPGPDVRFQDRIADVREKHEDALRHSLLKRLPSFKEGWSDEVKVAWLTAVTELWKSA